MIYVKGITLSYYTHGSLQYCQGWLKCEHGQFFIQPKEGYRNEQFWKKLSQLVEQYKKRDS